jgi:predicted DCC family thiol-disulfide oxidoreductase YuxK
MTLLPGFVVLFDGGCPLCRRTVRALSRLDWFGRLTFADASHDATRERYAQGLDRTAALSEMFVVDASGRRTPGFDGYLELSRGLPVLWVPRWIGLFPPVTWLGRRIYRQVAAKRARRGGCSDEVCAPDVVRPR